MCPKLKTVVLATLPLALVGCLNMDSIRKITDNKKNMDLATRAVTNPKSISKGELVSAAADHALESKGIKLGAAGGVGAAASNTGGGNSLKGAIIKAATNPDKLKKVISPQEMSEKEELNQGREAAATLLGAAPLLRDETKQRYVNRVGQWVAAQAESKNKSIVWRFGILDTPNINAFAAPGGYVFITKGLLDRLNNESELAGVLGHEIAHVTERHHAEAMKKKERMGAVASIAGDVVSDQTQGAGQKFVAGALTNVAKGLYASGLDKSDEYAADRLGVVYATRAGYHPYGLPRVIHMYAAAAGENGFELLFSTHPSPADRLSELEDAMGERLIPFETTGLDDTTSFKKTFAKKR